MGKDKARGCEVVVMVPETPHRDRGVRVDGSAAESAVRDTVGCEFDGECVVFLVDRAGRYVCSLPPPPFSPLSPLSPFPPFPRIPHPL